MTITICIGSSCHLKGSRTIIQKLEELITEHQLNDKKLSSMVHFAWANVQMVFV